MTTELRLSYPQRLLKTSFKLAPLLVGCGEKWSYFYYRSVSAFSTACCFLINSCAPCLASASIFCNC